MTTQKWNENGETCPAQALLRMLSGKWKPEIFRLSLEGSLRFNTLLRQLEGANKQSLSIALKELEENDILVRITISEKPLHVEYHLSEKGQSLVPVFLQLEKL